MTIRYKTLQYIHSYRDLRLARVIQGSNMV